MKCEIFIYMYEGIFEEQGSVKGISDLSLCKEQEAAVLFACNKQYLKCNATNRRSTNELEQLATNYRLQWEQYFF